MPTVKVRTPRGRTGPCYKWGRSGKTYCGKGSRAKANRQGRAAHANGYRSR